MSSVGQQGLAGVVDTCTSPCGVLCPKLHRVKQLLSFSRAILIHKTSTKMCTLTAADGATPPMSHAGGTSPRMPWAPTALCRGRRVESGGLHCNAAAHPLSRLHPPLPGAWFLLPPSQPWGRLRPTAGQGVSESSTRLSSSGSPHTVSFYPVRAIVAGPAARKESLKSWGRAHLCPHGEGTEPHLEPWRAPCPASGVQGAVVPRGLAQGLDFREAQGAPVHQERGAVGEGDITHTSSPSKAIGEAQRRPSSFLEEAAG